MAGLTRKIKSWFTRSEQKSMRYRKRHNKFDRSTDVGTDHKDHMGDRIRKEGQ